MKRNTSRSNGRHPNRALFGVAALVLLAVAAFSYRQWGQFKRANAEAAQTRDVVDSIDQLLSSVTDAETAQAKKVVAWSLQYGDKFQAIG